MKMITGKILRRVLVLSLVLFNIGCDQVTKSIVRKHIDYNESIKIISNNFTLTKVENSGAFLSSGDSLPVPIKFVLLSLLPSVVLGFGIYYILSKTELERLLIVGISFVIGGGIGNLYDRLLYGSVTDFLHIDFGIFQTGVFNIADVSIMIGMLMILTHLYFKRANPELA
ncbi:signal peptidase II [Pedobacter sp. V48]|uniref:signal peptidase II n=1 Tax=Pedobacter sp. V48 TaxID=509635 RepID=UPI0003E4A044|nr:signal peptidase II [Pedobacter sp. V48]ETZ22230.1 hypothetical protein N824_25210 [Pedobacter sp. V48]